MVSYHVGPWRKQVQDTRPQPTRRLAPKDAAILICKRPENRSPEQEQTFATLIAQNTDFHWLHLFAVDFRDAIQSKDASRMPLDSRCVRIWHRTSSAIRLRPSA